VRSRLSLFLLAALFGAVVYTAASEADDVSRAANLFGQALTGGRAAQIRPILPARGKVSLSLVRMGPEDGSFGASQVEAILAGYLDIGSVRSYDVLRIDSDGGTFATARCRANLVDRQGRPARVGIRLAFEREDGRWVLREIKELPE
jgi:hypothetical protein